MTYDELVALARRFEGQTLETVTGKQFSVGVALECPFFTPASSGYGQRDGRKASYYIGLLMAAVRNGLDR